MSAQFTTAMLTLAPAEFARAPKPVAKAPSAYVTTYPPATKHIPPSGLLKAYLAKKYRIGTKNAALTKKKTAPIPLEKDLK